MHLKSILPILIARLARTSETAHLDAQVLLAHVLGRPRAWVLAHPEAEIPFEQRAALEAAVGRLETGEPLPYVLGHWEFFGLDFSLNPAVLIPRPETELLVENALAWLRLHPAHRRACEVGIGSGCIAISLAVRIPDLRLVATDLSLPALRVAQANARRHGVAERVWLLQADLLPPGEARFDLICANLPYIPIETLHSLKVARREPVLALDGGPGGLAVIGRLLSQAPQRVSPGGRLLLEIEASQGNAVQALARTVFPSASARILPDLAGHDRVIEISL